MAIDVQRGPGRLVATAKLWLLGTFAVGALAAGTFAGATVLSPGADADADAGTASSVGAAAVSQPSAGAVAPMVGTMFDCPGGTEVGRLRAGDRVYVVGRDDSGTSFAIRNPSQITNVVWVEAAALVPDTAIEVDVLACDDPVPFVPVTATTTPPESPSTTVAGTPRQGPTATAAPSPGPSTPTTPSTIITTTTAAADTQAPTLQVSASRTEIFRDEGLCEDSRTSLLTVVAADNVGVVAVTASWSGVPGSPLPFVRTGGSAANGTWTATFGPFDSPSNRDVTITVTARDASGNSRGAPVTVKYWAMGCFG